MPEEPRDAALLLRCWAGTAACPLRSQGSSPSSTVLFFPAKSFFPTTQTAGSSRATARRWLRPSQAVLQPQRRSPDLAGSRCSPSPCKTQPSWHFKWRRAFSCREKKKKIHQTNLSCTLASWCRVRARGGGEEVRAQPWAACAEMRHPGTGWFNRLGWLSSAPLHPDTPRSPLSLLLSTTPLPLCQLTCWCILKPHLNYKSH